MKIRGLCLSALSAVAITCGGTAAEVDGGGASVDGVDGGGPDATTTSPHPPRDGAPSADAPYGWDPKTLPGLALWFDPDVGVVRDPSGNVAWWEDQSGNGNIAEPRPSPAGGKAPRFVVVPGALHAHDAIACPSDGVLEVADSPSLRWGSGDFSLAIVLGASLAYNIDFLGRGSTAGYLRLWNGDGAPLIGFKLDVGGHGVAIEDKPGTFHVLLAKGQNPLSLSVDRTSAVGPSTSVDLDSPGAPLRFCIGQWSGAAPRVVELIAARGTLSAANEASMMAYFATKYGL